MPDKNIHSFIFLLIIILLAGSLPVHAGYDFLLVERGARCVAMGGAFAAVTQDLNGIMCNPASLVGVSDKEATFTYLNQFLDVNSGFIGFNKTFENIGQFGFGILYTDYGEFRRTDIVGENLGSFWAQDYMINVSLGKELPYNIRSGISIKYIYLKYDHYSSSAVAADLGLIYRIEKEDLNIGLVINNLGFTINPFIEIYEKLPITYKLGISKRLAHLPFLFNFNLIKYQYQDSGLWGGFYWALGGEFTLYNRFYLRGGYNSRGSEEKVRVDKDRMAGISFGLGAQLKQFCLDYAINSFGALGMMNHFTFSMRF